MGYSISKEPFPEGFKVWKGKAIKFTCRTLIGINFLSLPATVLNLFFPGTAVVAALCVLIAGLSTRSLHLRIKLDRRHIRRGTSVLSLLSFILLLVSGALSLYLYFDALQQTPTLLNEQIDIIDTANTVATIASLFVLLLQVVLLSVNNDMIIRKCNLLIEDLSASSIMTAVGYDPPSPTPSSSNYGNSTPSSSNYGSSTPKDNGQTNYSPMFSKSLFKKKQSDRSLGIDVNRTSASEQSSMLTVKKQSKYHIDYAEIQIKQPMAQGAFGRVWMGEWRKMICAVKELNTVQDVNAFLEEAEIMKALNPHKNVVQFLGVTQNPLCIVTEFCEKGALDTVLHDKNVATIDFALRLRWIKDIAAGMLHLERETIIHKDLAARNVLITQSDTAKVADFGLSRWVQPLEPNITEELVYVSKKTFGPLKWLSPEALKLRMFSTKSDGNGLPLIFVNNILSVWAFAITIIEVLTREYPYGNMAIETFAKGWKDYVKKAKSYIPSSTPTKLHDLLKKCLLLDPRERPTFVEICNELDRITP